MPNSSIFDLAALKRRIARSRQRGRAGPGLGSAKQPRPRPAPGPPQAASHIAGRGDFVLLERLFENSVSHGSFVIGGLQSIPGRAVRPASNGTVDTCDPRRWVFLDTETTGLSGGTGTSAFLVGTGAIADRGFRTRLFFMRDFDEEGSMLAALAEHLSDFDTVVTFNGKTFDVPLLETRFRLKRQPNPFAAMGHFDALHPARRLWKRRLVTCTLVALESAVLGVSRRGDVPGRLIPQRYFEYLRSGNSRGLRPVFHHNRLDIVSLACLSSFLLNCLHEPQAAPLRFGDDLLSLARWVARLGDEEDGLRLYRKAIRAGLPAEALADALWESARLERRLGRYEAQVELLQDLARISAARRPAAWVDLAKHHEHREKDFETALALTRRAIRQAPSPDLLHRENRLLRKLKAAAGTAVSGHRAGGKA